MPAGYIAVPTMTYNTYSVLRMIPRSTSSQDVAAAIALAKKVAVYTLPTDGSEPRPTRHIDIADTVYEGLIQFDNTLFGRLNEILNEEPPMERDLIAAAYARSIGLGAEVPFDPDEATKALLDAAAATAHQEAIAAVNRIVPVWPAVPHWGLHHTTGPQTGFTFHDGDDYDIDGRALIFFLGFAIPKHLGQATFYVVATTDSQGDPLDGSGTYQLTVPANVPVRDYWALTVYDLDTCALVRGAPNPGLDSFADLATNEDGSVDITLSATPPAETDLTNWAYIPAGRPALLIFRFYGPTAALHDGTWQLNDLVRAG